MLDHEDQYRRDQLNHSLLDPIEEARLLKQAVNGSRAAIARLIEQNQRLVMKTAMKYFYAGMAGDLDLMDLVGWGNQGLLEAIRRWDPTRHLRFSTYATWWVRALIRRNALTRGVPMTRTAREGDLLLRIQRARSNFYSSHGCEPTTAEISKLTGISLRLVKELLPGFNAPVSLDHELGENGFTFENIIPGSEDTAQAAELSIESDRLHAALVKLPPTYAFVLRLRFGLSPDGELTYSEIARRLKVSRTRVQEIERIALGKLRVILASCD